MYAILETGGKQYKVSEGDVIVVEKLGVETGADYIFENVLAVENDNEFIIGSPMVSGANVDAKVIEEGRHKKVVIYKYKSKKGFHKKKGHRQPYTKLQIVKINF